MGLFSVEEGQESLGLLQGGVQGEGPMEGLSGLVVLPLLCHEDANIGMGRGGADHFTEGLETLVESPLPGKNQRQITERLLMFRVNRQGLAQRPLGFSLVSPLIVIVSWPVERPGILLL